MDNLSFQEHDSSLRQYLRMRSIWFLSRIIPSTQFLPFNETVMVKTTIVSFKNGAIPLYYMVQMARDKMHALVYVQMSEVDRFMTRLNLSFESTLFYLDIEGNV